MDLKLLLISYESQCEYIDREKHLMEILTQLKYGKEMERSRAEVDLELAKIKIAYSRAVNFITNVTGMTDTEIKSIIEK
ncbi:hypothetical protein ACFVR2_07480 [Gottfriedia sp. NPDC057991]|uniref:hypothetical protein n=1 Tax=Gottfriedia sp. NPDC057991 TaxID=3346298 RepID=UPI0036DA25D6